MIQYQILAICGMLSPIIYTLMWILGGYLHPGYSHIKKDISSLIATGAPNKALLDKFIISSAVLLFIFYLGLHWGVNNGEGSIIGPTLFVISSIMGILVAIFFPLDKGGEIITSRGKMHLILVILMGIMTIGGMIAMWLRLESIDAWSDFATFSLISAIGGLILVVLSVIFIKSEFMGLLERLTVSVYQLYYFILAGMVFLNN